MLEIINSSAFAENAYANKELNKATAKIRNRCEKIRANMFEVARIVAEVEETGVFKDDFKNVHQWTKEAFGFQKTVSYNLLRIGKEYVREVLDEKGRVVDYMSNLLPEESVSDFNFSQVSRMLPAGHDMAQELVESSMIRVDMPSTEITRVIKEALGIGESEHEPGEPLESVRDELDSMAEEFPDDLGVYSARIMDENGTVYIFVDIDENGKSRKWEIPSNIFEQYEVK